MKLQTKANTLASLSKVLKKSKIPLSYVFKIKTWEKEKKKILITISLIFKKKN